MAERKAKPKPKPKTESKYSPEYRQYLKRHTEMGEDRPKLTPEEFESFEDELLDLLALNDKSMTDDEIVRIQELEYLLIDAE